MTVERDQEHPAFEGWTQREVREALYVLPRSAMVMIPGMKVIQRPGWWQLITPSFHQGGLNEVSLSVLTEDSADAVIDGALADYRSRGLRFRWSLFPGSKPDDLPARLQSRGLRETKALAMVKKIEASVLERASRQVSPEIEFRLCDDTHIDAFTGVMARGWGVAPGPLRDYNRVALASGRYRFFIARPIGREWSAAGGAVLFARSVHLLGAVVLPQARGQGLYRALVVARLENALACGKELATTHALAETSAPILRHFGFIEWDRFSVFQSNR